MSNIICLKNRNEFKDYIKSNKFVIVKCTADWCGPCKRISPYFNSLFEKLLSLNRDVKLVIADADEGKDLCTYLRVRTIPTFMSYINGDLIDIYSNSSQDAVLEFMNKFVAAMKS